MESVGSIGRGEMKRFINFGFGRYKATSKFVFGFERVKYVSGNSTEPRWHWVIHFGNLYMWFVRVN